MDLSDIESRSLARVRLDRAAELQRHSSKGPLLLPENERESLEQAGVRGALAAFLLLASGRASKVPLLYAVTAFAISGVSRGLDMAAGISHRRRMREFSREEATLRAQAHHDLLDEKVDRAVNSGTLDGYIDREVCAEPDVKRRTEHLDQIIDDIIEQAMDARDRVIDGMSEAVFAATTRRVDPYGLFVAGRARDENGVELEPWLPPIGEPMYPSPLAPDIDEYGEHHLLLGFRDLLAEPRTAYERRLLRTEGLGRFRGRNKPPQFVDVAEGTRFAITPEGFGDRALS
jgi:hypothetical protein